MSAREQASFRVSAGLDEAGYGPLLGPLTIGFAAFRADGPLGWPCLADAVAEEPARDEDRLVVADSKRVFDRSARGARRLEATTLSFLRAAGSDARTPDDLFRTAPETLRVTDAVRRTHPWYGALPDTLPVHVDDEALERHGASLAEALRNRGAEVVRGGLVVVPAGHLNASFEATSNKSTTLWSYHSAVIAELFDRFGAEGLDLTCDRLGGRARYGPALAALLPFATVEPLGEARDESVYLVRAGDGRMRIRFVQKGDAVSLPTALGSCLAKYAREMVMDAFNDHFSGVCPGVRPTAGYVTDARRWLAEVERVRPDVLPALDGLVRTR
ncbi:MAG: hypothetical protein AAGA20_10420 [Planctomycetota bacterium]